MQVWWMQVWWLQVWLRYRVTLGQVIPGQGYLPVLNLCLTDPRLEH